jgi:hypothetical protein
MDGEQAAQLVFCKMVRTDNLLEAGAGVKASDALIQIVQHFEMDTLKQ